MKNKERAQLKAQYREELDSFREEVARFISLLKQTLGSKFEEAKFSAQPNSILANPQNLGEIKCHLNITRLCIPNFLNQHIP
jgi:DNA-binding XRE family transcriptional regulator